MITTNIPPDKLIAKTSGRIEAILVKDRANVSADTPLAVIENSANYNDIFLLKKLISKSNLTDKFPFELLKNAQLGDVESAFAVFQKDYMVDGLNTDLQPFEVENNAYRSESSQIKERLNLLLEQKEINEQELNLQKSEITRFSTLHSKGIISDQEYESKKINYLQSEKSYRGLLSSISQLRSSVIDNTRSAKGSEINGTKEEVNLSRNVTQSFYQLKKTIKDWELAYVLKSSIEGKVSFSQVWIANQTVASGDNVFSVVPTKEKGYVGKVKAPAHNSGKIKIGQQVNIRLANFPEREFGVLKGKVKNISLVPDKGGNLLIDISLPENLKTNYNKTIPFQQEMKGSAGIVTEDLRLLERILYQFRDVFRR